MKYFIRLRIKNVNQLIPKFNLRDIYILLKIYLSFMLLKMQMKLCGFVIFSKYGKINFLQALMSCNFFLCVTKVMHVFIFLLK